MDGITKVPGHVVVCDVLILAAYSIFNTEFFNIDLIQYGGPIEYRVPNTPLPIAIEDLHFPGGVRTGPLQQQEAVGKSLHTIEDSSHQRASCWGKGRSLASLDDRWPRPPSYVNISALGLSSRYK
jgi:hypothetical protein